MAVSDGKLMVWTDVNNRIGSTAPAVSDKFALFGFGSGEVQAVFRKGGLV